MVTPSNAKDMMIEMTAPIVVMALRQPKGKKHIFLFIKYLC